MRYALAVLTAVAALGVGSAFGASQDNRPATAAATDRAVVRELKALRREVARELSRTRTELDDEIEQVNIRLGSSGYDSQTVRGLLKDICDSMAGCH